jgi:hypothetical protein
MTDIRGYDRAAEIDAAMREDAIVATDSYARDRARKMSDALSQYATSRHYATIAVLDGDERSAEGHRADAREELHLYPALLALVEPS